MWITTTDLKKVHACRAAIITFKRLFGSKCKVTPKNVEKWFATDSMDGMSYVTTIATSKIRKLDTTYKCHHLDNLFNSLASKLCWWAKSGGTLLTNEVVVLCLMELVTYYDEIKKVGLKY